MIACRGVKGHDLQEAYTDDAALRASPTGDSSHTVP